MRNDLNVTVAEAVVRNFRASNDVNDFYKSLPNLRRILYAYFLESQSVQDNIRLELKSLNGFEPKLSYKVASSKVSKQRARQWIEFFGLCEYSFFKKELLIPKTNMNMFYDLIEEFEFELKSSLLNNNRLVYDSLLGDIKISNKIIKKLQIDSAVKSFMDYLWKHRNELINYKDLKLEVDLRGRKFSPKQFIKELGILNYIECKSSDSFVFNPSGKKVGKK